jgi:hypothetical protein
VRCGYPAISVGHQCPTGDPVQWSASFFPDSCLVAILCCGLLVQVLVVDLLWGLVAECRVETFSIVAKFDVPGNILSGVFTGRVDGAVDSFDFYCGVEGFGEGVVETYSGGPD